jgi:hypothetical protein
MLLFTAPICITVHEKSSRRSKVFRALLGISKASGIFFLFFYRTSQEEVERDEEEKSSSQSQDLKRRRNFVLRRVSLKQSQELL